MKKPVVVALLLLVAGLAAFFAWWGGDPAPEWIPGPDEAAQGAPAAGEATSPAGAGEAEEAAAHRVAVDGEGAGPADDPVFRAALCGFRGRVVTHAKVPVPDCGVRFYRGALDSVLREGIDLFASAPNLQFEFVAGETRTDGEGRFEVTGIRPNGAYILMAGLGTEAPMHEVVTKSPSPGEIVDLGDIVLPDAGIITGTVVDPDGEPLADALVRCVDLPGAALSFVPLERFEPDGFLLVRGSAAASPVFAMPSWVRSLWDHVPIPTTRTARDGTFRLVGVTPGSNVLAVTSKGLLANVRPSVIVRAGQEKDVGRLRMREGEELYGKVLDTAGEPVVGAEVVAGSTIAVTPFDLGWKVGETNEKGEFSASGFSAGRVTVAARRGPGHAWVLAEPQPIVRDVTVTLPATFSVDVKIVSSTGKPPSEPDFRLLRGRPGDGAAELAGLGFVPPVDLAERIEKVAGADGWRVGGLVAGDYTLVVTAPGFSTGFGAFTISDGDARVRIELEGYREFVVRVVDPDNRPLRNATIYARGKGGRLFDMPLCCGRTRSDGVLKIDRFCATELRVSAEHPAYGVVHGEATLGQELVLRMQAAGSLSGVLSENGGPPEAGRYTLVIEWRRNGGPRGAFDQVPRFVTPAVDGSFRVAAIQPGQYRLSVVEGLQALRSPGGFLEDLIPQAMYSGNRSRKTVDVAPGQDTHVLYDVGEAQIEGPTAHLYGSVVVNGRVAEGHTVTAQAGGRRYMEMTDRSGSFDFGTVPAGSAWVQVRAGRGLFDVGGRTLLWTDSVELAPDEEKELLIEVDTSSISGTAVDPSGAPVSGRRVTARGRIGKDRHVYLRASTDDEGRFRFDDAPVGDYSVVLDLGRERLKGQVEGISLRPGAPVSGIRIELAGKTVVSGRVDLAMFGEARIDWIWIKAQPIGENGKTSEAFQGIGVDRRDGKFETDDLEAGTYAVRVIGGTNDGKTVTYRCQDLAVPPEGLEGLVLHGTPE